MIEFLASLFEDLDEMVYISDSNTYEMIYMNRILRESLGYSNHQEYLHKKCHLVLQGISHPCLFCNQKELRKGTLTKWIHRNPLLNRQFLIFDSLFTDTGHQYRIEIAKSIEPLNSKENSPYLYSRTETILSECLQCVFSSTDPEESLHEVIRFLGERFQCDRAYVFEIKKSMVHNTYEWCKEGVFPQQAILQNVPVSELSWWIERFKKKETVIIHDLEEIRLTYPSSYSTLKPQNIHSLVAGPILMDDQVIGFIGADNPHEEMFETIEMLMKVIGYFLITLLKRRDLLKHLNDLSFHDALTGAFNRNALFERYGTPWSGQALGVIYCDVNGLKQTNDTWGHIKGDQLLQHCYNLIHETFPDTEIYRAGGDEFVIVFPELTQLEFLNHVQQLKQAIKKGKHHLSVGHAWSCQPPLQIENLIYRADQSMYQDKKDYYKSNLLLKNNQNQVPQNNERESLFNTFVSSTYCDMELIFDSISQHNSMSYFYFGDMQKNLFYISDNMRDEFGFDSNIVSGLLQEWTKKISSKRDQELFQKEMDSMLKEKRTIHDMRYQVKTVSGRNIWIRCYGVLKWDELHQKPLFFSGRVSHQDENFVVDPVTNFPRESTMLLALEKIQKNGKALVLGFNLHNITELNNSHGRAYSDTLIQNIADSLVKKYSGYMSFYRLNGMRCAAVIYPPCHESKKQLIGKIQNVIINHYRKNGIFIQRSCSFAVIEYPQSTMIPSDLLEQLISLLKVAKHEINQEFIEYSTANVEKTKKLSEMALALNHDVLHDMENFRIVVQPLVSVETKEIIGGEVLLRWRFENQDISPNLFIQQLEKNNMIHLVGRWVFEQTVRTCLRSRSYNPSFFLSFNVSLKQIADLQLPDLMVQTLQKYALSGDNLIAEVTESCMDEDPDKLLHFMDICKKNQIRIALDDFGSGYSSLRMLLQYPSDVIKLDRTLLAEMTESNEKINFISSIVYACHRFGKSVCMEEVETEEQFTLIRKTGCDFIQGFYCYRPMELETLYQLLADSTVKKAS